MAKLQLKAGAADKAVEEAKEGLLMDGLQYKDFVEKHIDDPRDDRDQGRRRGEVGEYREVYIFVTSTISALRHRSSIEH